MEFPNLATGGDSGTGNTDESEKKSLLDKLTNLGSTENKPEEQIDYSKLENAKTKSIVETRRENASQELQELQALEDQRIAQLKVQEGVTAVKKTGVYITIAVICGILLICLVLFFIALAKYLREPVDVTIDIKPSGSEIVTIDNYTCENVDCEVVSDLSDGRQLIKDGSYIIFDQESEESFLLALDGSYSEITDFAWGDKQYLLAKDSDNLVAIFLITENRYITDAIYESVISDQSDEMYSGMEWIVGQYIVAKRSNSYRLVNIEDGSEKVSGPLGVFATKSGYYISKEEDGVRRVFNSSKTQIILTKSGTKLYERDGFMIVSSESGTEIYKNDGQTAKQQECSFYSELKGSDKAAIQNRLNGGNYFAVP